MVDPDLWHPCWQDSERHALFVTGKDMKNWNDDIPQQLRWIATRRFPPVLQNLEARHRNWSISFSDISLHLEIYRELEGGGAAAGTSCFHLQILHWLSWDIYKKKVTTFKLKTYEMRFIKDDGGRSSNEDFAKWTASSCRCIAASEWSGCLSVGGGRGSTLDSLRRWHVRR